MSTPLPWRRVIAATFRETLKDDAQGLAAQLSFHFFLSLFAMLLALVAFASLFPLGNLAAQVTGLLAPIAPALPKGVAPMAPKICTARSAI